MACQAFRFVHVALQDHDNQDCYCGFPLQGDLGTNDVEFVG